MIFTRRGININEYPTIKKHLEKFKSKLEPKPELHSGSWQGRKAAVDAERLLKIQRTVDRNSERLRAMADRRSAAEAEGLATEASRLSTRRKLHPLTVDEKAEKAKADAKRRHLMSSSCYVVSKYFSIF